MPFTQEQRAAIESRGENLLVAAAAGSGKTTVLVERVMQLLAEGANIDEMLIVTFTRAAASELRAKLARRLMEASGALEEQSVRLERATITTIHGFCAELLRAHFESAGVSAGFRVLDEANARRMEDEALDEALEEAYAAFDGDLDALDFGRGPKKVRAMAQDLLRALDARPDPQAWIDRSVGEDWQPLFDVLAQAACASLEEARDRTDEAHSLVLGSLPGYEEALAYDMAALYGIPEDADYAHLHKALRDFRQERLKPSRGKDEFGVREFVKLLREEAKRAVQRAQSLVALSEEDARADMKANRPALRALARLAQRAQALLDEKKAEEGALSYGDLERYALRALRVEECARAARERWKWIFVDEYQDTSEIQEAILSALVGQGNAFFVGDVKQSIYRFRMAEPELFLRRQARYARGEGGRLIALTANFRSSDGIVDFVNAVFERALRGGADEIAYTGDERLRAARAFAGERVELHILSPEKDIHEIGADEEEESEAELLSGAQAEAQWIAGRIHSLMEADPTLRYRDIAVLTRVKQNVLAPMARVLADEGIPVYADEAGGYTDAFEVRLALALLKLVDNHLDDLSLLAVLRSPLVGLSSRELAQLRLAAGDAPLYEAVLHSQDPALAAFARQLDAWRDRSRRLPLGQFVDSLLMETGLVHYASAMPSGAARRGNLHLLSARAAAYEENGAGGLAGFLRHTETVARQGGEDAAHALGENDDVVRLMSVHKSKGLEFPVVFAAQLGRGFRGQKADDSLSWHAQLGFALPYTDPALSVRRETLARRAIACRKAAEDLAEEKRILYVLLTRARDRLILVGTLKNRPLIPWRWKGNNVLHPKNALDIVTSGIYELGGEPQWHEPGAVPPESRASETLAPRQLREALLQAREAPADEKLAAALAWRYPYAEAAEAPLKLTITGLVREIEGPAVRQELVERPAFLSEGQPSAAQRGTDVHRLLARADLSAIRAGQWPEENRVRRFFASPLGQRLLQSSRVEREWAFDLRLQPADARRLAGLETAEPVMVQGVIDACFLEDGAWVIVDYKSGRDDEAYHRQIRLYAHALAAITQKPVKEAAVFLLQSGAAIPVPLA